MEIKTKEYGTAFIMARNYSNGRLALQLETKNGEPIATLTVNLPDEPLGEGEFFVKTWSENEQIAKDCMKSGLFLNTGKKVPTGHVQAQVWMLNPFPGEKP